MSIHILHTPMKEVAAFSQGDRYCFTCRKRRQFIQVVSIPRDKWSYYGPTRHIECIECRTHDGDVFPSRDVGYRFDDE